MLVPKRRIAVERNKLVSRLQITGMNPSLVFHPEWMR